MRRIIISPKFDCNGLDEIRIQNKKTNKLSELINLIIEKVSKLGFQYEVFVVEEYEEVIDDISSVCDHSYAYYDHNKKEFIDTPALPDNIKLKCIECGEEPPLFNNINEAEASVYAMYNSYDQKSNDIPPRGTI